MRAVYENKKFPKIRNFNLVKKSFKHGIFPTKNIKKLVRKTNQILKSIIKALNQRCFVNYFFEDLFFYSTS